MKFDNTGIEEYNVHFINFIKSPISINIYCTDWKIYLPDSPNKTEATA